MKNTFIHVAVFFLLLFSFSAGSVFADDAKQEDTILQSALSAINIDGGISAGYFYASNPGDASNDAFLLSNLLVELSSTNDTIPVGFTAAFGETSTPSILDTPENNTDFKIEYASINAKLPANLSLEAGMLQPNAGFENTYTFNNKNIILGAIASQQPYNSYGARVGYEINGVSLWGGYYNDRLDDEEYNSPDYAWEAGMNASLAGNDLSVYNYHIGGQRNLFGAVVERTIGDIDLALNIDYWSWDNRVKDLHGSRSSIGAALYICPNLGSLSIPVRLEYINQDKSEIYIESRNAKNIYGVTVSPTWHFNEKSYIRAESAYVKADRAFTDKDGKLKDNKINLAVELGYLF